MAPLSMMAETVHPAREAVDSLKRMHPAVEAKLIENHREFLRFLGRRLGNADTAEEVLQQFYLRVVSKGSELRETESVLSWLYAVLRTTLIDHYRKEAARRRRESEYAAMQASASEAWDHEPEETDYVCLYKVLPTLKPEYSDVLRRVDLRGAPPRRVAEDLGIGANNVRVRLHRARQALKAALIRRCGSCAERGCRDCDRDNAIRPPGPLEQHPPILLGTCN